jgi:hypothetical protein
MTAHTMVRPLVSVVNASIWKVALPYVAKETFNGIGRTDIPMHDLRKSLKRQEMLFIFHQAAHRFGILLLVFAFECRQLGQGLLFRWRLPDPSQFRSDRVLLSDGGWHSCHCV